MQMEPLHTARFVLRPLRPADASEAYSRWFDDPEVAEHILSSRAPHDVASLRRYIAERMDRDDVLFLGIFTADAHTHIGNLKYEPVDTRRRTATMGILIGDPAWRGKGVAQEVIVSSSRWLQRHHGIRDIALGVDRAHQAAIAAYERIGFQVVGEVQVPAYGSALWMTWRLDEAGPRHGGDKGNSHA